MSQITDLPSEAKALSLLHTVSPDSKLVAIRSIADDHHNVGLSRKCGHTDKIQVSHGTQEIHNRI